MNDATINQLIAEACGWTLQRAEKPAPDWPDSMWNLCQNGKRVSSFRWWNDKLKQVPPAPTLLDCVADLPNYVKDLNAIHAAVATLPDAHYDGEEGFTANLARVTQGVEPANGWRFRPLQEATARQRAEAFLRTIGKWPTEGDRDP